MLRQKGSLTQETRMGMALESERRKQQKLEKERQQGIGNE